MKTWEEVGAEEAAVKEALKGCRDYQTFTTMSKEELMKTAAAEVANDKDALMASLERLSALHKARNLILREYLRQIGHPGYV
jgi:predicted alpha/beta hydrolase